MDAMTPTRFPRRPPATAVAATTVAAATVDVARADGTADTAVRALGPPAREVT